MARKPAKSAAPIVGDQELARLCDVSPKTVYNWRKAGMPAKRISDKVYEYNLDDVERFRATLESAPDESGDEVTRVKLIKLKAQAATESVRASMMQREERLKSGEILDRDAVELWICEAMSMCRDSLLRLPRDLAKLVPTSQHKQILAEGERLVTRALAKLANDLSEAANAEKQ